MHSRIGIQEGSRTYVPGHGAILLDAVLEAVELPAGVTDLDPGLADVDADDLPHLVSSSASLPPVSPSPPPGSFPGRCKERPPLFLSPFPKCVRSGDKRGRGRGGREGGEVEEIG